MKTLITFCLFSLISLVSFSQDFANLPDYELKAKDDFVNAEKEVLACANYLFSTPNTEENAQNRAIAAQFIVRWMEGTKHSFEINENSMETFKGNDDLFGLYMAGMTKVVLENEGKKLSASEVHNQTEVLLAKYCADKENATKPSKRLKQVMKTIN